MAQAKTLLAFLAALAVLLVLLRMAYVDRSMRRLQASVHAARASARAARRHSRLHQRPEAGGYDGPRPMKTRREFSPTWATFCGLNQARVEERQRQISFNTGVTAAS